MGLPPLEYRQELFRVLLRAVDVHPCDPATEEPPGARDTLTTKIRAHRERVRFTLYELPGWRYWTGPPGVRAASEMAPPGRGKIRTLSNLKVTVCFSYANLRRPSALPFHWITQRPPVFQGSCPECRVPLGSTRPPLPKAILLDYGACTIKTPNHPVWQFDAAKTLGSIPDELNSVSDVGLVELPAAEPKYQPAAASE